MTPQLALGLDRRPGVRFEDYLAGPNAGAVAALREVAVSPADAWIGLSGPPGVGRTHLLAATAAESLGRGIQAIFVSAATLRGSAVPDALQGLEACRLLCLDDVDALLGDRDWEVALFHLLNRLRDQRRGLVFSASQPARRLGVGLPDLASRLTWGIHLTLDPLNDAQKEALLHLRASRRGVPLDAATCSYMLRRLPRDVPTLVATLDQLADATLAAQRRLTPRFVGDWLARRHDGALE